MDMLVEGNIENWRKAGKIAAEALEYGKGILKKGALLLEVADKIDDKIKQLGGSPAWPTQLSMDHIAAHSTPEHDDETVLEEQVICLDVGVEIDGCIGDNAVTVDLSGKYSDVLKASEE